jgi:uncharacterized protein YabE (DUF348 family)
MRINYSASLSFRTIIVMFFCSIAIAIFAIGVAVRAEGSTRHLITIHDGASVRSIISNEDTLREAFKEANILINDTDRVEPGLDQELVGNDYQVNIYRARPITIIDGVHQIRIMTAYQTPKQIAKEAGIELRSEDRATILLPKDIVADGASLRMAIDRAIPIQLDLYGENKLVYTQTQSVREFLKEKAIKLSKDDRVSVDQSSTITANMHIRVWREGKQTITLDEVIEPPVEVIKDASQPAGYEKINDPGKPGRKSVTYEVVVQNGYEVSRHIIQSVDVKQPLKKIITIGVKPSFSGDFAAALAKLRSCEGGYDSWNNAGPYYGAYQFNRGTWNSVADPNKYGNASPAEQDEAARKLYERRGWQPWPHCGANLPDIYR